MKKLKYLPFWMHCKCESILRKFHDFYHFQFQIERLQPENSQYSRLKYNILPLNMENKIFKTTNSIFHIFSI